MKKFLSLLLALAMVCSLLPMAALALDEDETDLDFHDCQKDGHNYVADYTEKPSCEFGGYTQYVCTVCDDRYDEFWANPLGHEFLGNYVLWSEPTCDMDRAYADFCTRNCGCVEMEWEEGTALGHEYVNGVCIRCDAPAPEEHDCEKDGHNYVADYVSEPECEWVGSTWYVCTYCGDEYEDDFVDALEHIFSEEPRVLQEATCTLDREVAYDCLRDCGNAEYVTEYGTALGHDYVNGICSRCDYPEHEHAYVTEIFEGSCDSEGYTLYTCTICGDSYEDDFVFVEHTFPEGIGEIAQEATCTSGPVYARECLVCGTVEYDFYFEGALGHEYEWFRCIRCGRDILGQYNPDYCGHEATWTLENGVLTILGTGPMYNFDEWHVDDGHKVPWADLEYHTIVISDGITHIGDNAFYGDNATSVSIPDSVTSIGYHAFYMSSMTKLELPSNLQKLGEGAFMMCQIEEVTIPGSLKTIGQGAFSMGSLKSVVIEEGVEVIGDYAFQMCNDLASVSIPESVSTIGRYAFADIGNLHEITIPANVKKIGFSAFSNAEGFGRGLQKVTFCGSAPVFEIGATGEGVFSFQTVECYYPAGDSSWDAVVDGIYLGFEADVTWIPYGEAAIAGDMDGNGVLDDKDVAQLLWHTLFPASFAISGNADFNGDGQVDDADVAYLLWHTLFPEAFPL